VAELHEVTDIAPHGRAAEADPVFGIEIHGLDPIPSEDQHGSPNELVWTWLGGAFNYVALTTGALTILFGLSIWQAIAAALIGSVLGALIFGFTGIFGPKTHTATIVNTRAAFGLVGNYPAALISWLSASGWVAVNSVLAVFALVELADKAGIGTGAVVKVAAVVVVLLAQVGIALFGHATVVASERVFAIISIVVIFGVLVFALPKVNWSFPQSKSLAGSTITGTWFLGLSVIFAAPLSWVNYGSDYSRYLSDRTSMWRVMMMTFLGMGIASVAGALIGTLLATVVDMSNPIASLPKVLPGWYLVPFLLVVIWGAIANNVLNLYTAGLGLLALRVLVPRWVAVALVGGIAAVLTFIAVFFYNFMSLYAEWLSLTLILLTPWTAILVVDYFVRRGRYDVEALHTWGRGPYWYRRGINWAALAVYAVGIACAFALANSTLWTSPISKNWLGGADLSLEAGLLITGVLYYFVAKAQLSTEHVRAVAAEGQA